jgi:gamma-glutamyltranspeptidase/glutathione hydrolase
MTTTTRTTIAKTEAVAKGGMVASKDRRATAAGLEMLELGGNAVDAAVAAAFAIGVVEPGSSGVGGGGYLVYQVDGRGGVFGFQMRGPLGARPDMYALTGEAAVGSFGWPGVEGDENLKGPRSVAVPGAVAGLCEAQARLGRLPLSDVIAPAITLARYGFVPGWHALYALGLAAPKLLESDELARTFLPGGQLPASEPGAEVRLRQEELADVLEAIAERGPAGFYRGEVARAIVAGIADGGGILTEADLAEYRPYHWDRGLEFAYSARTVRVPPFACAGLTSAMTLKLFERSGGPGLGHNSIDGLHAYIASARLAYADRYAYMSDPEMVRAPWRGLLAEGYLAGRAALIDPREVPAFEPGDPWAFDDTSPGPRLAASAPAFDVGTTHLCAMDGDGNAVSLTNTLMASFGSGFASPGTGVVLNNGMMWFDPVPGRINSIQPGKRALNNMTPALVLSPDGAVMAVGASGGRRITNCVTQLISKVVDFGMGPQEAIDSPRVDCSLPETALDPRFAEELVAGLRSRGHRIHVTGDMDLAEGFSSFASPVAIVAGGRAGFRAGVDTFHSAHAEGI